MGRVGDITVSLNQPLVTLVKHYFNDVFRDGPSGGVSPVKTLSGLKTLSGIHRFYTT